MRILHLLISRHKIINLIPKIGLCVFLFLYPAFSWAQQFDLLLKNGHVIDPKNGIHAKMDLAIKDDKIASVAGNIPQSQATKTIDATNLYVVPGLIDMHTHVFVGSKPNTFADGSSSVSPDDFTLRSGVTTVVDAGTSGWRNFPVFKANVIDQSKTRILALLNIAGAGMSGKSYQENILDMNPEKVLQTIQQYPEIIVGVKIGHFEGSDWTPFDRALEAGRKADVPLLVECHLPQYSLEAQLNRMRPGDIITHSYEKVSERMPVVDEQGKVMPFVLAAQKKGVLFDVGHGGAGFWFDQAVPALKQGLAPNTFGTDLHRFSMNAAMKSMLNLMSKYLNLGMPMEDMILRATWNAAKAIKREDLGHLSEGAVADIAVLSLQQGKFGFTDAGGNRLDGNRKLESELTIRAGKVVWDLNGIAAQPWKK